MNGKQICGALREIRRHIASANDIDYAPAECEYKGECSGTCPHCESEMRYIERQLRMRQAMGKAVVLAGLTLSSAVLTPAQAQTQQSTPQVATQQSEPHLVDAAPDSCDVVLVRGTVIDKEEKEPIIGATISIKDTNDGTATNIDGAFAIRVKRGSKLFIKYIGMKDIVIDAKQNINSTFLMDYDPDAVLTGEVVIVGPPMHAVDADIYQPKP